MLRPHHILPLIVPLLLIALPSVVFLIDSRSGAIPSRAAWQSAPHSNGPWTSSWLYPNCILLGIGGIIVTGCGAAFAATTGRDARPWAIQGVGIVIASVFVFYYFGWLFE